MAVEFDYPLVEEIARNVDAALAEDVGAGDLTAALVPAARAARATVVAMAAGAAAIEPGLAHTTISLLVDTVLLVKR